MTLYIETPEGFRPWLGGLAADGNIYPRDIEGTETEEKLAAAGLFKPFDPGIPPGKQAVRTEVVLLGDVVTFWYDLEDIPAPHPRDRDLTKRQLRLALYGNGFPRTFVQDTIDAITDPIQRDVATIWWEDSPTISWNNPMTQTLIGASGLSGETAIAMWVAAWGLEE